MGANTGIEWAHHTFNPWWGCTKVSDGCKHCYADTWSRRTGHEIWGPDAPRRFFGEKHWREPLAWNERARREGVRYRVFCASMSDWAEEHADSNVNHELNKNRARLFRLIADTPHLDWLLLTKRIHTVRSLVPWGDSPPFNVWLGTSVEDQAAADLRVHHLLSTPAAVRFLSCEPMLGPVDLRHVQTGVVEIDALTGDHGVIRPLAGRSENIINWVIVGGESGPNARPMHSKWATHLRDQCEAAGTPFLFKQWGEWMPAKRDGDRLELSFPVGVKVPNNPQWCDLEGGEVMARVGKKAAGRMLGGREYNGIPSEAA